jgi:hypothetical protein
MIVKKGMRDVPREIQPVAAGGRRPKSEFQFLIFNSINSDFVV